MKSGYLSGIDKPLSRIVLGTTVIDPKDKERGHALLDTAYESGINAFDTAVVYGTEQALGSWINERSLREKVVVISKGCHLSHERKRVTPIDLASDIRDSLARLEFDYIDIYLFHRDDPEVPVGPLVVAMNEQLNLGRIRAFGGSNWSYKRIQEANEFAEQHGLIPFTVSSPNYSLAEQVKDPWEGGCETIGGPQKADAREWCRQNQIAVFAYSSLARGLLSGRITRDNYKEMADSICQHAYCYEVNFQRLDRAVELAHKKRLPVPQIALAFILNSPMNIYALVAATTREECETSVAATDIKLTPAELAWLDLQTDTL